MDTLFSKCERCGHMSDPYMLICPRCGGEMHTISDDSKNAGTVRKYNLWSAYVKMFKSAGDFSSRSTRSEYWYAYLMNFIITFTLSMLFVPSMIAEAEMLSHSDFYGQVAYVAQFVNIVYGIIVFVPQFALTIRRLHDIGTSGTWAVLSFFPVGSLFLLFFLTKQGTPGVNRYGQDPRGF